ncbi:NADH-quinone oxidoreductase subunit A [Desulfobaculum bizertense]|uniref:NADH-quinone oxidoreductase subunit n=1 Tax=Desulfobaculum bizertense DSM 18034 TaxID=1121442 RepID=A0A1T4VWU7_9BACT|nr:NADH-quinone oxidoreductase subunit A [Desulfobaculum bizertense]SKA69407.1 NADH-quinone oxidoreductase subunit A [Desulfobaculum bizertense DSM 18034]
MVFSWLNVAILLALIFGFLFAAGPLLGGVLLAPKSRGGAMGLPYECGAVPHGSPHSIRFSINYAIYALLFLAFDVDVLYLFPVATYFPDSAGWWPLIKLIIFIVVLALGCVYFWKKGVFEWPRKIHF